MSSITILHNPRCSKSRQTLALLQEKGIEPVIVDYLKSPLDESALRKLYAKLALDAVTGMMRLKEPEFKEAGLNAKTSSEDDLFSAMATYPKLIERPIVINNEKARIGRPPESVLDIL